jgi:FkbM family methyltransferase
VNRGVPGLAGPSLSLRRLVMGLQRTARAAGVEIHRYWPPPTGINVLALTISDVLLRRVLNGGRPESFTFLQVGANDGTTGDPIFRFVRRYGFRGVCVEPQPEAFARLRATYQDLPRVAVECAAIAEQDGVRPLYRFRPGPGVPAWADMLASFSRELLVANTHGVRGEVEAVSVPTVTLQALLSRHQLNALDLLQIDTEGFDFEIVKLLDLSRMRPTIINLEVGALAASLRQECLTYLSRAGYSVTLNGVDAVAYLEPPDQALSRDDLHVSG